MIRTQIQLTESQVRRLKQLATERGVSIAALIREAVDRHIVGRDPQSVRERAVNSIGGFRSGLPDVSEEHDRYLAKGR